MLLRKKDGTLPKVYWLPSLSLKQYRVQNKSLGLRSYKNLKTKLFKFQTIQQLQNKQKLWSINTDQGM